MTEQAQLQTSADVRTKIAADAESAKQAAYHPHTAMMHLYCDQVLTLLADVATLEAECGRLRERAEDDGTKDALEEALCELMDECFQLDAADCPMPAAPESGPYRAGWFDARKSCLARIKGRICGLAHLYGTRYTKECTDAAPPARDGEGGD